MKGHPSLVFFVDRANVLLATSGIIQRKEKAFSRKELQEQGKGVI